MCLLCYDSVAIISGRQLASEDFSVNSWSALRYAAQRKGRFTGNCSGQGAHSTRTSPRSLLRFVPLRMQWCV